MFPRGRQVAAVAMLLAGAAPTALAGGTEVDAAHRVKLTEWVASHRSSILDELIAFVSLPNVAASVEDMRANATHLQRMLEKRGLETRILESPTRPYVFARLRPEAADSPAKPVRVLVYAHFDGQPVEAPRWTVTAPFTPKLVGDIADREARLYARSASDDKGPIVGILAAIDALRAEGLPPSVEAKFLFDPEEEAGSPSLEQLAVQHADLLAA